MSRTTLVHSRHGAVLICSNDCVCQNGAWLVPCTDSICREFPQGYLTGKFKPNFPVPAIRQHFEFMVRLNTNEVVLMRTYQGPYSCP